MKKSINIILLITIVLNLFIPYINVKASNDYSVMSVKTDNSKLNIGQYSNYESAKEAMNNHNSDNNNVACIYQGDKIINCKYATVTLLGDNPINLYKNPNDSTSYTSTHPYYGRDAAFIDYDINSNRVKIMISGFTGWTSIDNVSIIPISMQSMNIKILAPDGINIRNDHSTSATKIGAVIKGNIHQYYDTYNDGKYTWYKIYNNNQYGWIATEPSWIELLNSPSLKTYYTPYQTGNLLHYYRYATNSQGFTNLGPNPSYLNVGKTYYSFDGNYFYESLIKMLSDYKAGNYNNAVNKNNPYYAYYLYLTNHTKTGYTADDFNKIITDRGYNSKKESAMYEEGRSFIESQELYGVNALLTFSAALNESATGTSEIALDKNNLFGHGAYDSCPYTCATAYSSVKEGILNHARMTGEGYNSPIDWRYFGSHYGNKGSGMNIKYATDPYWGEKAAMNAFLNDYNFGLQDYNSNTIGIKTSDNEVQIKKLPSDSSQTIYSLKNSSFNVPNMPVIVIDKVNSNGEEWYKVYTDVALDDNQNINNSINYSFDKSYGYIKASSLYVNNNQPVISASDITVNLGDDINLLNYVTASDKEDGDISNLITYETNIDLTTEGKYRVTYKVSDSSRFSSTKTVNVNVVNNSVPIIDANDITIKQYKDFNPLEFVTAKDNNDGNLNDQIIVISNNVNTSIVGNYQVKYSVTNSNGKTTIKEIKVEVIGDDIPVIEVSDKTIILNDEFKPLDGVIAKDKEDGDLTSSIEIVSNDVDIKKVGIYSVTYKVTDSAKQEVTKTIKVNVVEKVLEEKSGLFYLDYIKEVDGLLQLKGYNTIAGIDNNLDNNITYKILFENIDNGEITELEAIRITNKDEIVMTPYSVDGKDYTYSWFKFNFDLDKIKEGNYKLYIKAESSDYYSKAVISNKLYQEQVTSYTSGKNVIISRDFNDKTGALEFKIRNNVLAKKTSSYIYNQYDVFEELNFNNNKLHIMGLSYSYGANLSTKSNINRKIIFENKETFEKYEFDLGSITSGLYKAVLPVNDNLDKTRAWYDADIDLSLIPKGDYVIYITTTSNITDISELTEKLGRNLKDITATINNKKYSFNINYNRGNRVEMSVN